MSIERLTRSACVLSLGAVAWLAPFVARADMILTAEAPGVQGTTVAGATTESFNGIATGKYSNLNTSVGTFSAPGSGLAIHGADAYGGAGNTGNYFAIGAESSSTQATLTLNGPQSYFGFWWSAADAQNSVEFLSQGHLVATFNSASALGALSSGYNSNPNTRADANEKFAYLNFYGTDGTTFDQVVFLNASTGSGFEADNFSVQATAPSTDSGRLIPNGLAIAVPAPGGMVLMGTGLIGLALAQLRRRSA